MLAITHLRFTRNRIPVSVDVVYDMAKRYQHASIDGLILIFNIDVTNPSEEEHLVGYDAMFL
jgi:hypothetical protein